MQKSQNTHLLNYIIFVFNLNNNIVFFSIRFVKFFTISYIPLFLLYFYSQILFVIFNKKDSIMGKATKGDPIYAALAGNIIL